MIYFWYMWQSWLMVKQWRNINKRRDNKFIYYEFKTNPTTATSDKSSHTQNLGDSASFYSKSIYLSTVVSWILLIVYFLPTKWLPNDVVLWYLYNGLCICSYKRPNVMTIHVKMSAFHFQLGFFFFLQNQDLLTTLRTLLSMVSYTIIL